MKTSRSLGFTHTKWVVSVDWTQRSMSGWIDPSLATDICRQHSPFVGQVHEYFMAQLAPLIAPGAVRLLLLWATHSCRCSMSIRQGPEALASSPRENTAPLYGWHPLHQPPWFLGWIIWRGHGIFDISMAYPIQNYTGNHIFCCLSLNLCVKIPSFCWVKPTNNSHMWSTNYDKLFFFGDHEYYPPVG